MLDKFRNLSETGKMIVVGIIIAVFVTLVVIVSSLIKNNDTPEPVPTVAPQTSQTSTPEPTETSPSQSPKPTELVPVPSPSATINYGETTLSNEEARVAQDTAKNAILEYTKTDKGENNDVKNERLRPYFEQETGVFDETALEAQLGLETVDENNFVISRGTVDYIDPVGGNEQEYKVVIGSTVKIQYNTQGTAPQILESNNTYVILLSKASGSWKVTSLIES